ASAGTLRFASQNLTSTSEPQIVTLANRGTVAVQNLSFEIDGDFFQTNSCGHILPAYGSCDVNVSFKPSGLGDLRGSIQITGDIVPRTTISLEGTGVPRSNISGIWANEGGDKVTRDELRASRHLENLTGKVMNHA